MTKATAKKTAPKKAEIVDEAPETKSITIPNTRKVSRLEKSALAKLEEAKSITITNIASYEAAGEFAVAIREGEKAIEELYEEHIKNAHKAHKDLTTARGRLIKPLAEARVEVQGKLSAWDREQRRLAQIEADKLAEKERLAAIKQATKEGDKALVKELKSAPVEAFKTDDMIRDVTPKVSGVSSREIVSWKLVNADLVPREFLMIDESKIKAHVKAHGMETKIAGIEVFKDVQTQIRGN